MGVLGELLYGYKPLVSIGEPRGYSLSGGVRMGSFSHLLHKNLLNTSYVQDSLMGPGDSVVNRRPPGGGAEPMPL